MTIHSVLVAVERSNASTTPSARACKAATLMQRYLEKHGYSHKHIKLLCGTDTESVSHDDVNKAFSTLDITSTDDVVLVMFAGHGLADKNNKFAGWALSGDDKFTLDDITRQHEKHKIAHWIMIHDCCYSDPTKQTARAHSRVLSRIIEFMRRLFDRLRGYDPTLERLQRLAQSATDTLRSKTSSSTISIGAAGIVTNPGEVLLPMLLVGCAIGRLTYSELIEAFRLVKGTTHAFSCMCPSEFLDKSVLT
jgi:hypothetical protein